MAAKKPEPGPTEAMVVEEEPTVEEPVTAPKRELTSVKYVGTADVKRITVADLAAQNVEAKMDLRFDRDNDFTVSVKDMTAATLDYLRAQPDFRIS